MEKTGSFEDVVFKEDGKLKIRLAGGEIIPYDNRFPQVTLKEGESLTVPKED